VAEFTNRGDYALTIVLDDLAVAVREFAGPFPVQVDGQEYHVAAGDRQTYRQRMHLSPPVAFGDRPLTGTVRFALRYWRAVPNNPLKFEWVRTLRYENRVQVDGSSQTESELDPAFPAFDRPIMSVDQTAAT